MTDSTPGNAATEHPVTLTALLDMSYAESEGRSNDEPYGFVRLRVHIGDQDFRGPSLDVRTTPEWVEGREQEVIARAVAQWMLDLAEKGHGHYVRGAVIGLRQALPRPLTRSTDAPRPIMSMGAQFVVRSRHTRARCCT